MSKKGYKLTEEHKRKIGLAHKGRIITWAEKIGKSNKGKKRTSETKLKLSLARRGRKMSGTRKLGWKLTIETRKKMSESRKGEKSYLWKGGISSVNQKIRSSLEYKLWRESVFKRDNYTCIWCNKKGVELNADHIKPFAYFPELRFAIDNGRTLCVDCHKTTDTFKGRSKNYKVNQYIDAI